MIYVNVKSFDEMTTVAKWSGDEILPSEQMFNQYKEETAMFVVKEDGFWSFAQNDYYREKRHLIMSFKDFEQQYLDGTATQDIVNHPNHYNSYSREVIDTMQGMSTAEEFKGHLKLTAVKYLSRYQGKNGVEDLKKAQWYLNKLTEVVENEI